MVESSRWSSASGTVRSRSAATWPIMNMPRSHWSRCLDGDQLGRAGICAEARVAVDALGGDAQPADVQPLEAVAHLVRRRPGVAQPALLGRELVGEGRRQAAGGVARTALEQHRALAGERLLLEAGRDRAALRRLRREEVGGAEQHADVDPVLGSAARPRRPPSPRTGRRGSRRRTARGSRELPGGNSLEQDAHHRVPEHEARPRADVAAALAALEHEPARAVVQVQLEQAGRGDVQVGRDALVLQLGAPGRAGRRRSARTAAGGRGSPRAARRAAPAARSRGCPRPTGARRAARAVCSSRASTSGPRISASARNGSAPPSATAAANSARSLTRVIGPWTIG